MIHLSPYRFVRGACPSLPNTPYGICKQKYVFLHVGKINVYGVYVKVVLLGEANFASANSLEGPSSRKKKSFLGDSECCNSDSG